MFNDEAIEEYRENYGLDSAFAEIVNRLNIYDNFVENLKRSNNNFENHIYDYLDYPTNTGG